MAGYGLLPRLTSARTPIHDTLLSADAVNQRIQFAYRPTMISCKNCLVMPQKATVIIFLLIVIQCQPPTSITDTYLISFWGIAMAGHWIPILANRLMILSGQKISQLAGMPLFRRLHHQPLWQSCSCPGQSLQIEINRSLYMRRPHQIDADGAARVSALLTSLLKFLDTAVRK